MMDRRNFVSVGFSAVAGAASAALATTNSGAAWDAMMAKMIAAEAVFKAHSDPDDDTLDALRDAQCALMELPSPNGQALRWKLDHIMESSDGETVDPWSMRYLAQAIADYRRLLGAA